MSSLYFVLITIDDHIIWTIEGEQIMLIGVATIIRETKDIKEYVWLSIIEEKNRV